MGYTAEIAHEQERQLEAVAEVRQTELSEAEERRIAMMNNQVLDAFQGMGVPVA